MDTRLSIMRWLLCPTLFALEMWRLYLRPAEVTEFYPVLWDPYPHDVALDYFPANTYEAYVVGEAIGADPACGAGCLATVRAALHVPNSTAYTAADALGLKHTLKEMATKDAAVDRAAGLLSFANIIWLLSILGILLTVGPVAVLILSKLMLLQKIGDFVKAVVVPAARAAHEYGIVEAFLYIVALLFVVQGARIFEAMPGAREGHANHVASSSHVYVSLTGVLCAAGPLWLYSAKLHLPEGQEDPEGVFMAMSFGFAMLVASPMAMLYQSSLYGFLAVLAGYGLLGFFVRCFGLCWVIGFHSRSAMHRSMFASLLVLGVAMYCRGYPDSAVAVTLRPFRLGGSVMGHIAYLLAWLIMSSKFYRPESPEDLAACGPVRRAVHNALCSYHVRNSIMLTSLLVFMAFGYLYAVPSFANTATTFLVLWLVEKQTEVRFQGFLPVVILLNSIAAYKVGYWLNDHPQYITEMFK